MMRVQIFFAGRHTAAQMTFGLVILQDGLDLGRKRRIEFKQSFRNVLVYRSNNYNSFYWHIA